MTKACTTHHHACACRESHFRRLQQDNSWAEEKLSGMAIELAELREALERIASMCNTPGKCACGRTTGVMAKSCRSG